MVADPRSSFRGRPKKVVGFWGKAQNFYVGFEGGPRTFYVGFESGPSIFHVDFGSGPRSSGGNCPQSHVCRFTPKCESY